MINKNPTADAFLTRLGAITATETPDTRAYAVASAIIRHNAVSEVLDKAIQSCRNDEVRDVSPAKSDQTCKHSKRLAFRLAGGGNAWMLDNKLFTI